MTNNKTIFTSLILIFILVSLPFRDANGQQDMPGDLPGETSNYAMSLPGGSDGALSNIELTGLPLNSLPYTIEIWIKPEGNQADNAGIFYHRGSGNSGIQYSSGWQGAGKLRFMTNSADDYGLLSEALSAGVWHHLAVVLTSTSRTLYVDGKAYTEQGTYSAYDFSAGKLYLGWDSALPGRSFKGEIDEVRVWNTERKATELENAKKEVLSGEEEGLLAYWNFDDAADEKVSDLSGTQHGIIHGGTYVQSSLFNEMEENPSQYIAHQKLPVETLSNSASTSVEGANFASFQQNAITTYNGYQYVSYWNQVSQVCIARKKLPVGTWEEIAFTDYTVSPARVKDNHYTISMGICENDGSIHLAFDHHNDPLHYRKSLTGLANQPDSMEWSSASFGQRLNYLVEGKVVDNVTYPRFIQKPDGDLLFECRLGWSGDGDDFLWDYTASNGQWSYVGEYLNGTNVGENAYINGLNYDPNGRLHVSWVWRQTPDAQTNHDVYYAYSDDDGRTWYNADGIQAGTAGTSPMGMHSEGLKVWDVGTNRGLINQESQAVDNNGGIHILQSYIDEGVANTGFWNSRIVNGKLRHIYRDDSGEWHNDEIGPSTRNRSEIAVDENNNLFVVAPNYRIYFAAAADQWQNWIEFDLSESNAAMNEGLIDREALLNENVLSFVFAHSDNDGKIIVPNYLLEKKSKGAGKGLNIKIFDKKGGQLLSDSTAAILLNENEISIPGDSAFVQFEGILETSYAEAYILHLTTTGAGALWINEVKVLETEANSEAQEYISLLELQPSHKYRIRWEGSYGSKILTRLEWSSESQARELVPAHALYEAITPRMKRSANASLSALSASEGVLSPAFSPSLGNYTLLLPGNSASIEITALTSDPNATVEGAGTIDVSNGSGSFSLLVKAENEYAQKEYKVSYITLASNNALLASLSSDRGKLTPAFDPSISSYQLEVPSGSETVQFEAVTSSPFASVEGHENISLSGGKGSASIIVTAADGTTTKTYNVEITSPVFALKHSYTFDDGTANDHVGGAHATLHGGSISEGIYSTSPGGNDYIELPAALIAIDQYTELTVEAFVSAGNGSNGGNTMLSYFGDQSGSYGSNYFFTTLSNGGKSRAAISCGNTSSPWSAETTVDAPRIDDGKKHHVSAHLSADIITWYIDGQKAGESQLAAHNAISELGTSMALLCKGGYTSDPTWKGSIHEFNIYNGMMPDTMIQERAAEFLREASDNARLSTLSAEPGRLEPAFDPEQYSYTLYVEAGTEQVLITALAEDENATVSGAGYVTLEDSSTLATIKVTAEDGSSTMSYTVNITRKTGHQNDLQNKVQVYPTQNSGSFTVVFDELPGSIAVYDVNGRLLHRQKAAYINPIQLPLKRGTYFIETLGRGKTEMHRILCVPEKE